MLASHFGHRLTQGSIFSCAVAARYPTCRVYGLVITARCDMAHDKADVVSYLPVVRFVDWANQDGIELLRGRCRAELSEQFHSLLRNYNISTSLLVAHSPLEVVNKFFSEGSGDRNLQKARSAALEIVRRNSLVEMDESYGCPTANKLVGDEFPKLRDRLIKECVSNHIAGYYFLPDLPLSDQSADYVALMREVRRLSGPTAEAIADGMDFAMWRHLDASATLPSDIVMQKDDFAYSLGVITSPQLEHIMQCFALLYTRIGLPDVDPKLPSTLAKVLSCERSEYDEIPSCRSGCSRRTRV